MPEGCRGTNRDGSPCSARALPGEPWCVWHHPDRSDQRDQWNRAGGRARSNQARARKQLPADFNATDLRATLAATIGQALSGAVAPGVATSVASLARAWLAANEQADLVERIEALEDAAATRRGA